MATAVAEPKNALDISAVPFASQHHRKTILSLLLLLLSLLIYNPVVHNGFVSFDDPGYVTTNLRIHSGLTWKTVQWAFESKTQANWHPLTWLSHALDWQLFGPHAAGHHYDSVLLHALCVVLLFKFLADSTQMIWRSAIVAALFAVHPINVESVAWIAERKNVLCMVFFFLALLAYRTYVLRPNVKHYLVVAFWFALGLMAKPMVITLPFVLLLLDYWPFQRIGFGQNAALEASYAHKEKSLLALISEKLPLFLLVAASAAITMVAQKKGGAMRAQYSLPERLINAAVSYAHYVDKAFWPSKLACLYPHPGNTIPIWQVIAAVLFLFSATLFVLKYSRQRYFVVGWLWFLGTLIPVIGLVQVGDQAMADRYAYLPFIGLFIAIIWGVADWAQTKQINKAYLGAVAITVITAASIVTHIQIGYWHDSMTLWSHTLRVTTNNFIAHDNIGVALLEEGKVEEAKAHFQAAIDINPRDAFSQLNIGVCEKDEGNTKAAMEHYQSALEFSSDPTLHSVTLGNMAVIYRNDGNYHQAQSAYEKALELDDENAFALTGMGLTMQKLGDLPSASSYYLKATQVAPSDIGYLLLAQSLEKGGHHDQAHAALNEAIKISKDFGLAQQTVQGVLQ